MYAVTLEIILRIYDWISKNTFACIDISSSSRKTHGFRGDDVNLCKHNYMFITCMR